MHHTLAKRILLILSLGALAITMIYANSASAAQTASDASVTATLNWEPPSARIDGSTLSIDEIGGYNIYTGTSTDQLTLATTVDNATITQHQLTGLPPGTHYFAVTTVDANGIESGFSTTVNKEIPNTSPPGTPAGVTVNVQISINFQQ